MSLDALLIALLIVSLVGFLLTGYPVAFVLAGTALLFAAIGALAGVVETGFIALLPERIYGIIQNELLLAVPLFIVMGVALERSRVAEDLLDAMGRLFGPVRGGLGFAVTIVGALLAASTGIVGATVVTMGLLSLPTMLRRGYDPALACGTISAAGTLGQIIPPSIVLILLADVLSSAYQQAQRALGIQATKAVSVGELFAGALLPGIALVLLYLFYQALVAWLRPQASPAIPRAGEGGEGDGRLWLRLLRVLIAPVVLIVTVLGSILAGIATPTEAAAVGAVGAVMLGAMRLRPGTRGVVLAGAAAAALLAAIAGLHGPVAPASGAGMLAAVAVAVLAVAVVASLGALARAGVLGEILLGSVRISTMIYAILIGAAMFSLVFRALGGDIIVEEALAALPGGAAGALVTVMVVMFLLGFFLDFIEITFVVVPIVAPILFKMGVDPVWLGVLMAMNLQTSFLTPPFGFALFYLRGVAPAEVPTAAIYRGAVPYVVIQLLALALLAAFPGLATWLPRVMAGG